MAKLIRNVAAAVQPAMTETLPERVLKEMKLMGRAEALRTVHAPSSPQEAERAQTRLRFEELFLLQLTLLQHKKTVTEDMPGVRFAEVGDAFNTFYHDRLPFELTDAHGKVFRSSEMKGKVWIATFFFTGCTGACPRLLNAVDELRQQLGERPVTFVSISNDPDRVTPRVLKEYSAKFKAGDQWRFLTGQQPLQIRAIGSEFFNVNAGAGETHSEKLTVVDKWGKVRGHFSYDQETEMIRLRLLLDELLGEKQPPAQKSGKN